MPHPSFTLTPTPDVPAHAEVVAVPVFEGPRPPESPTVAVDVGRLERQGFEGKAGQAQVVGSEGSATVVAVGMGPADEVSAEVVRKAASGVVKAAWKATRAATTVLDAVPDGLDRAVAARAVAEGAGMAAYRFTTYKSDPDPCRLEELAVVDGTEVGLGPALDRGATVAGAVCLARDLVNEPAGTLTPARLAEMAAGIAEQEGLDIRVMDETAIADEGLGGLAGVARGSAEPPRLVELVYEPPGGDAVATLALVGKGITFDSGGLSIKTAEGMMTMKTDMSGAAAVLATMSALPALEVPVRVLGFMPTTENMPGGTATKPGDVLRIRNGKTVEVLNTDAEGRLVLADGLSLAVEAGADVIVDVATLTGAQIVALGKKVAGLMGNDEALVKRVQAAAERAGEAVWPLPLPKEYRSHIDSDVADVKNIGKQGEAGSLIAGLFLQEFVDGVPWAHLDIAGPARSECDDGYVTKGGTGFAVRTLLELVESFART
ncbi:MAG: leucyl aminopeptidase [Actinomycetota bacterium]|nr:leucyl aminopeptidase [Actinomycetota bacterium]